MDKWKHIQFQNFILVTNVINDVCFGALLWYIKKRRGPTNENKEPPPEEYVTFKSILKSR